MKLTDITPVLLTFNEADNLERTLQGLNWAERIVLVDSGSTDNTRAIADDFEQVHWLSRPFDDFASQRNFGLQSVNTPWVLSLDADHQLSPALAAEIAELEAEYHQAFFATFRYCIWRQPLCC